MNCGSLSHTLQAAKTSPSPHPHALASEKWMLGWGSMFSPSTAALLTPPRACMLYRQPCTLRVPPRRVFSPTFFRLFKNGLLKMRGFQEKPMSIAPTLAVFLLMRGYKVHRLASFQLASVASECMCVVCCCHYYQSHARCCLTVNLLLLCSLNSAAGLRSQG